MQAIDIIYSIIILIMSVVIHEVAHGYAALYLGDPTAKYEGRLTLNPLKHLDPFGSVLVPILTYFTGGFVFGWARPVPYNPYNLKNPKVGEPLIALAGPVANFVLATIAALILSRSVGILPVSALSILFIIVVTNIGLMVFNLVPIYPLDGSKILFAFLPARFDKLKETFARYSIFIFLIFVVLFSNYLGLVMQAIVRFLVPGV